MASILNEIINDKIQVQHFSNDKVRINIKKPEDMSSEKFKVYCARLSRILSELGCHMRLR
jgi:hypothetical protein